MRYASLADEVRVGDYYLRVLLLNQQQQQQQQQPNQSSSSSSCLGIEIKDPVGFFDELYRRFLTAPKCALRFKKTKKPKFKIRKKNTNYANYMQIIRLPSLHAMALVYGRHRSAIGYFADTGYLVSLLERTFDYEERDRLVCLLEQLVAEVSRDVLS